MVKEYLEGGGEGLPFLADGSECPPGFDEAGELPGGTCPVVWSRQRSDAAQQAADSVGIQQRAQPCESESKAVGLAEHRELEWVR